MRFQKTIATGVLTLGVASGYFAGHETSPDPIKVPEKSAVEKMQEAAGDKKLYYAYKKSQLGKKQFGVMSAPPFEGATIQSNGVVSFAATPNEVEKFKSQPSVMSEPWVIAEERIYTTDMGIPGCSDDPDFPPPGDTPPLDPPDDTEWQEYSDDVDWGVLRTRADEALYYHQGESVTVCVIDTGVDMNHPDLRNIIVSGGRSYVPGTNSPQDDEGHGSHVAGIIASEYDNAGMGGASQARVRGFKALDSNGSGASSWLMNAIIGAADSGCQVISNSWGSAHSYGPDPGITDAIEYAVGKGALLVFAAGNDSGRTGWPAAYAPQSPNIYAVSASDQNDQLAYFSSRGPEISVMAPGVDILSVRLGGGYVSYSGTSMAAPYVSAALALMIESGQSQLGVDNVGLPNEYQGEGRVNFVKTIGM